MKYYPFIFFYLFIFCACTNDYSSNRASDANSTGTTLNNDVELEIFESFTVNYNNFLRTVTDFKHGYYTLFNYGEPWILLVSGDGTIIKEINQSGGGPNQYGSIMGVSIVDEQTIMVCDYSRYYFYDLDGNPKGYQDFPNKRPFMPLIRIFSIENYLDDEGQLNLLLRGDEEIDFYNTDMFSVKLITVYNVDQGTYQSGVKYAKEVYQGIKYPANKNPFFSATSQHQISVIFPYEKKLSKYSLPDLNLIEQISTNPTHFEPLNLPRENSKQTNQAFFDLEYTNSQYFYLKSTLEGYNILAYKVPCGRTHNNDPQCWKTYLQVFKEGKKQCEDIAIDERYLLEGIFDLDHILLLEKNPKTEENKFFRARIKLPL